MSIAKAAVSAVDAIKKSLSEIKNAYTNITGEFKKIKTATSDIVSEFKKINSEIASVFNVAVKTSSVAKAAFETAEKIGISTKVWTRWKYTAEKCGVSADVLKTGFLALKENIAKSANDNKQAVKLFNSLGISIRSTREEIKEVDTMFIELAEKIRGIQDPFLKSEAIIKAFDKTASPVVNLFDSLGISVRNAWGEIKEVDKVFIEVVEKINGIQDPILKSEAIVKAFGETAGPELVKLINCGAEGIKKYNKEADKIGIVFTDEEGRVAISFAKALHTLHEALDGVYYTIGKLLIPELIPLIEYITDLIVSNKELIKEQVKEWISDIKNNLPAIIDGFKKFIDCVNSLVNALGGWKKVLPYIVAVFLIIKLFPLISIIISFIEILGSLKIMIVSVFKLLAAILPIKAIFLGLLSVVKGLFGFVLGIFKYLAGGILGGIKAMISAIPVIGWIILIITALVGIFIYLWKTSAGWKQFWSDVWDTTKQILSSIYNFIKNRIIDIINAFKDVINFLSSFWDDIKNAWSNISNWLQNIIDDIINYFRQINLINIGKQLIDDFLNSLQLAWQKVEKWLQDSIAYLLKIIPSAFWDFLGIPKPEIIIKDECDKTKIDKDCITSLVVSAMAKNNVVIQMVAAANIEDKYSRKLQHSILSQQQVAAEITFNNLPRNAQIKANSFNQTYINYSSDDLYKRVSQGYMQ